MERARFFGLLRLARASKKNGDSYIARWVKLFWYKNGFADGWYANK